MSAALPVVSWSWIKDKVSGAGDYIGETYDGASDYVGEQVDSASDYVSDKIDDAGDYVDDVSMSSSGVLDTALGYGRDAIDFAGDNVLGFGADMLSVGGELMKSPAGNAISKFGTGLGAVTGPAAVISGGLGLYDEFTNKDGPDANNVAENGAGMIGGGFGTLGTIGTLMGGTAGGAGTAGSLASLGPIGAIIGSGAAGLTVGHELAEFSDSEYGQDENNMTEYDKLVIEANRREQMYTTLTGSETIGKLEGIRHAAMGGPAAGLVGGAKALYNWATD